MLCGGQTPIDDITIKFINKMQQTKSNQLTDKDKYEAIVAKIDSCQRCKLGKLDLNKRDISKGYGKLMGYYKGSYKNKVMLVGMSPSYRRYSKIYHAFGGEVFHFGTGYDFMTLLKELNLLDKVYITNLIKCSASKNIVHRTSTVACYPHLLEEIRMVEPKKIICLGAKPYQYLKTVMKENIEVAVIPHPTYWSSYYQMSKKEYSNLLCQNII